MPSSATVPTRKRRDSSGLTVDATGAPAIDPTENVLALVDAAQERSEAIRALTAEVAEARLSKIEALVALRAEHAKEIRQLESDRLDKIRMVDVLAANTAAERAQVAIQTLATTTTANADTLRSMVSATAAAIASQTAITNSALTERIASLEKSSYTGAGKQAVADPMITELVTEMRALRISQAAGAGKSQGSHAMWGYVAAGFGFLLTLGSLAALAIRFAK